MAMVPIERYEKVARRQFEIGEQYPLEIIEARDMHKHRGYFAAVNSGFKNLPEIEVVRFPSVEHLRKWCLIETGWCDEKEVWWDTQKDARRSATMVRQDVDEYARIHVSQGINPETGEPGWRVLIRRAKSQAVPAMKAEQFKQSSKAVLDMIESMIGLNRGDLRKHAGRAADD